MILFLFSSCSHDVVAEGRGFRIQSQELPPTSTCLFFGLLASFLEMAFVLQGCMFVGTQDEVEEHEAACPSKDRLAQLADGAHFQFKVLTFMCI